MPLDPETLPPDAPEADAVEQRLVVTPEDGVEVIEETPSVGAEVPEADALEQAITVPSDDERYEAT